MACIPAILGRQRYTVAPSFCHTLQNEPTDVDKTMESNKSNIVHISSSEAQI